MNDIILSRLPQTRAIERILVKVPEPMYQVFWDLTLMNENKDYVKKCIIRDLNEWVNDNYPGYGIAAFSDYNSEEAKAIADKTGYPITWGMYLVLEIGASMTPHSVSDELLQSPKIQIDNAKSNKEESSS